MTSQQTRIAGLLDQLSGLGTKRTGMPIDADDWNALIDAVRGTLEVAAAQDEATSGALDLRYAPTEHEHLAEVTTEWLDADLRSTIASGGGESGLGTVVGGVRVGTQVTRLLDEVGRVRVVLEDQQARIDRSVTADLDRTKDVVDLRGQVAAVNELRGVVSGVQRSLRATTTQISELEGFRAALTDVTGAPIDVGALQRNVTELSRLRENLTDGQGNLVRMRDVLAQIEAGQVVGGGAGGGNLDNRFDDLRGVLDSRITERLTAAETRLDTTGAERNSLLRAELSETLTASIGRSVVEARTGLEQAVDARVGTAEQRLGGSFTIAVADATAGVRAELAGLARSAVRDGLADVDARIGAAVDVSRSSITETVRSDLSTLAAITAEERAGAAIAPLSERVAGLAGRVEGLDVTIDASVSAAVDARTEQLAVDLDNRTSLRLDEARAALLGSIADEVGRAVVQQVGDLDARVVATVEVRLADLDARIDQRVSVRTVGLAEQVRVEVANQVSGLDIRGQLDALEGRVSTNLRAELAAVETRVDSRRSTAISELGIQLRNENEVSRAGLETRLNSNFGNVILRGGGIAGPG